MFIFLNFSSLNKIIGEWEISEKIERFQSITNLITLVKQTTTMAWESRAGSLHYFGIGGGSTLWAYRAEILTSENLAMSSGGSKSSRTSHCKSLFYPNYYPEIVKRTSTTVGTFDSDIRHQDSTQIHKLCPLYSV